MANFFGAAWAGSCIAVLSVAGVASAHEVVPIWLDADPHAPAWVSLDAPAVVRGQGSPWLSLQAARFSEGDATILRIVVTTEEGTVLVDESPVAALPSVRAPLLDADLALRDVEILAGQFDRPGVESAYRCFHEASHEINAATHRARWAIPRSALDRPLQVRVSIQGPDDPAVVEAHWLIPLHDPLPRGDATAQSLQLGQDGRVHAVGTADSQGGPAWHAGDQHLHCQWSLDAWVLSGTDVGVAFYADTARTIGLDWAMITDHSNINAWWFGQWFYTPEQHAAARAEAEAYRAAENWPALYSQEMGLGNHGFWELPSHVLVYPLDTWDAPYIENPSSGLVFGHANCEDEQVVIDRINASGCFGFIAHPYRSGTLSYEEWNWDNGATGWAGIEIWSNEEGEFQGEDAQAREAWFTQLKSIRPPAGGVLPDRAGFPTRFPVAVGNSDAHEPGLIGRIFTYARLEEITPSSLKEAFLGGRCVASNGPLVVLEVNTAGIGEVALLPDGRARVVVRLESTPEFGAVDEFELVLEADGADLLTLPTGEASGFAAEFIVDAPDMLAGVRHATVRASAGAYHAFTNPVWLQVTTPADVNGDGAIDVNDLLIVLSAWGPCPGCPADIDGDGTVAVNDVLVLLGAMD